MDKSFFLPRGHNWDIYVLLILICMYKSELEMHAQIRPTSKVLHGSASNYTLSDLH